MLTMDKPIRILQMIGGLNVGGSQTVVLNTYKAIDRKKIQFDFIIDKPAENKLIPIVEDLGAAVYKLPAFNGTNIIEVCNAWDHFFCLHPEYKVMHSHIRSYASLFIPIAKRHGVKTVIHSHSTSNGPGCSGVLKSILQYPLRYQADFFLSCSDEAGEWLFGRKIVSSKRYHCLQNSIDPGLYCPDAYKRTTVRKKMDIDDKFVFIHVGRLHAAKNHNFLLRVFAEIRKEKENAVLLLVGDGELRDKIRKDITHLKLNQSVFMLGIRDDVPDLLRAADCFLFPSIWEGLPVTVIEAQAAGLPCVISANISDNAFITPLAHKVPIDQGVQKWITCLKNMNMERQDVSKQIRDAGFDVHETADWISRFYLSLYRGEEFC